jgi:4-amino-4-deoxy-L-arabinose transferase-like glycosyltransferase
VVGVLALVLRLGAFGVAYQRGELFHPPDSEEYDQLALNLAARGVYSLEESAPRPPDLTRTPVYPFFVAGCYCLAGHCPELAVAIQISLAVGTVLLIWGMARRLLPASAALTSACLLALDPLSIHFATLLLSETLFTLLFYSALYCLLVYLRGPGWGQVLTAGLLTGLAILCRPIAVFWPLALLPGFLLVAWHWRRWQCLGHYCVFVIGASAVVAPWIIRNERAGGLAVLTTVKGINLYYHRAAMIVADQQGVSLEDAQRLLKKRLRQAAERDHLTPAQEYRLMERWGEEIIAAKPGQYLGKHLWGVGAMFLIDPPRASIPGLTLEAGHWLEGIFLTLVYGLGLVGLIWGLCGPKRLHFLLLALVPAYFAVLSGPEAYDRFRVPVMPAITLLAGAGLAALVGVLRRRTRFQADFQKP